MGCLVGKATWHVSRWPVDERVLLECHDVWTCIVGASIAADLAADVGSFSAEEFKASAFGLSVTKSK
ncbi:MAG: hypothetical protein ABI114_07505 [Rhodanobacter sp.]